MYCVPIIFYITGGFTMKLEQGQVQQRKGTISIHFYSEKEAHDFIMNNGLDTSYCKHYFKEGTKLTLATNSFVDMYDLFHKVKDYIIKILGPDDYQLSTMVDAR